MGGVDDCKLKNLADRLEIYGIHGDFIATYEKPRFYEEGVLIYVMQAARKHVFLSVDDDLHHLDAKDIWIDDLNSIGGLRLSEETVAEYVRFFLWIAGAGRSPFVIVETDGLYRTADQSTIQPAPLKVIAVSSYPRSFTLAAAMVHEGRLHRCELVVAPNGMIEMTSDDEGVEVYRLNG
ncbi:hypothetical protein [Rhodopila sp.]|uniref:hypothetical protein n=1 Tax=Rhodopila sp. TaxID=2480087 RepID=UPI003D13DBF3